MTLKASRKQNGVVSIEFAIGFFSFWLMVSAWIEMSYMSYVSAMGDYAISEASRQAKKDTETYIDTFKNVITQSNSVWRPFVDPSSFSASVRYIGSLQDLYNLKETDTCLPSEGSQTASCGVENNSALAVYSLTYDFKSIFTYYFDNDTVFTREIIVVQEYERDKFSVSGS